MGDWRVMWSEWRFVLELAVRISACKREVLSSSPLSPAAATASLAMGLTERPAGNSRILLNRLGLGVRATSMGVKVANIGVLGDTVVVGARATLGD